MPGPLATTSTRTMTASGWSPDERRVLEALCHPAEVQALVDTLDYEPAPGATSPRVTLRRRRAHCFSGAILAAAAMRHLGHPPRLLDLRAVDDDDHVLALFREDGLWGAVAQSNFTTLRYREPAYRSLRELVMSYFDLYFNVRGKKSLREYSRPLDLRRFDDQGWMFDQRPLARIEEAIERQHHYRIVPGALEHRLRPAPDYLLAAGLLGADPEGLYTPGR